MSEQIRVHNPNPFEVVIDRVGHGLGGHTAGYVTPDEVTKALIDSGRLLVRPGIKRADPVEAAAPAAAKKRNRATTADNGTESGE